MDLLLLCAIVIIVLLTAFLLFITFVPLDLWVTTQNTQQGYRHFLAVFWGPVGLRWVMAGNDNHLEILLLERRIFRRRMEEQAESPTRREKAVPAKKPLWDEHLIPLFLDAARDAWRQMQLLTVRVHLKAGFEDPSQTGILFGYMSALRGMLYPVHAVDLSMEPLFDRVATEWDAALGIRIRHPSYLLPSGFRIAWRIART